VENVWRAVVIVDLRLDTGIYLEILKNNISQDRPSLDRDLNTRSP
jgi:hypothetical protein